AIDGENALLFEDLLKNSHNLFIRNKDRVSAFDFALRKKGDFLELLNEVDLNSSYKDEGGGSVFCDVCSLKDPEIVKIAIDALKKGINLSVEGNGGESPFICAIHTRNYKVAELMVEKDPSVINYHDDRGWNAMDYILQPALQSPGSRDMAVFLLEKGIDVGHNMKENLNNVIKNYSPDLAELMIEKGAVLDRNVIDKDTLERIIRFRKYNLAKEILDKTDSLRDEGNKLLGYTLSAEQNDLAIDIINKTYPAEFCESIIDEVFYSKNKNLILAISSRDNSQYMINQLERYTLSHTDNNLVKILLSKVSVVDKRFFEELVEGKFSEESILLAVDKLQYPLEHYEPEDLLVKCLQNGYHDLSKRIIKEGRVDFSRVYNKLDLDLKHNALDLFIKNVPDVNEVRINQGTLLDFVLSHPADIDTPYGVEALIARGFNPDSEYLNRTPLERIVHNNIKKSPPSPFFKAEIWGSGSRSSSPSSEAKNSWLKEITEQSQDSDQEIIFDLSPFDNNFGDSLPDEKSKPIEFSRPNSPVKPESSLDAQIARLLLKAGARITDEIKACLPDLSDDILAGVIRQEMEKREGAEIKSIAGSVAPYLSKTNTSSLAPSPGDKKDEGRGRSDSFK
nr:hypothetical protein [Rickettsiaceae bacterium]